MDLVLLLARLVLATVFLIAGIAKLADLAGSRKAAAGFGVPSRFASAAAILLPIAEIAIAAALVPVAAARWGALAALALLGAFIAAIGVNLARGRTPDCHCFGQLRSAPAGWPTIARNGVLAMGAAVVAFGGWNDPGYSAVAWLTGLSRIEAGLLIGGLLALGILAGYGWILVNLMSLNGRLLARLDDLERASTSGGTPAAVPFTEARGLSVGAPAPAFALPDVNGVTTTLDALSTAGAPVLLLFSDPGCGPCDELMRNVGRWQRDYLDALNVVVVSRGSREANLVKAREHGLDRVLLQQDQEVAGAYGAFGTPAAVLVRPDGTIGTPLAGGIGEIQSLVATELAASRHPSSIAPEFRLPNLDGVPVRLEDLRSPGLPVLLVFTDPRCGPCYELLPDIGGWQRVYGDRLTFALVSAGAPESNRAMTAEYGFAAGSILLQGENELAEAYGAEMLPAAVLIDTEGRMARPPARGAWAVRALVADALGLALPEVPVRVTAVARRGQPTPSIRRPDLDGSPIDFDAVNGSSTVLLFWSPGCVHCQDLLPAIRAWEAVPDGPRMVVITNGPVALNRGVRLRSPMIADDDRSIAAAFGTRGAPAAVVIDGRGIVASDVAGGATAVRALLDHHVALASARPLAIAQAS